MPRPSNTRTQSRSSGSVRPTTVRSLERSGSKSKRKPLVEEDDWESEEAPARGRKKRSKEQSRKADAPKRDVFEELVESLEGDLEEDDKLSVSKFQDNLAQLLLKPQSEGGDPQRIDTVAPIFFQTSLNMIMDLIPIAEKAYRKNQRESSAYALAALVNQGKDLITQVKMSEDTEGQALVLTSLVRSRFLQVAELLLRESYAIEAKVDGLTTDSRLRSAFKAELKQMVTSYARGLQGIQELLQEQVRQYLLGNPEYLNPKANLSNGDPLLDSDAPTKKRRKRKMK